MESCRDFIQCLGHDLSMKILTSLESPSDIIRWSAVSTSWRNFAIMNGLSKQLCLKKFPELSKIPNVIEEKNKRQLGSCNSMEQNMLLRDHKVYAYLARGLASHNTNLCISNVLRASSTDHYPEESPQNTLEPRDRVGVRASYWSSTGQTDPTVPEKLVYSLISNVCVVTEIHVQPFQECSENGFSIYSPKAVRFRMGYSKSPTGVDEYGRYKYDASRKYNEKEFSWTYSSPEFPMAQENCLQKFKLPEPALCIGGILQIELLGRVQSQATDNMYYIRVTHVQVVGRLLSPGFEVDILDSSGRCELNYYPGVKFRFSRRKKKVVASRWPNFKGVLEGLRQGEQFIVNSAFRRELAILFLIMAFIFLDFIIKFLKNLLRGTY